MATVDGGGAWLQEYQEVVEFNLGDKVNSIYKPTEKRHE